MKIKIRQHHASIPREDSWSQTGDWLAKLRDDDHTEPPGGGHAGPDSAAGSACQEMHEPISHHIIGIRS